MFDSFISQNILSEEAEYRYFFICVFFIGFLCALQFLSLLYIYESIKVNPKHELAPLFTTFSAVISALYTLPFAIVANNYRKR